LLVVAVESPAEWVHVRGFRTRGAALASARRLRWRARRADPALPAGVWEFRVDGRAVLEARWHGEDVEVSAAADEFAGWWGER
jgi:hypothetical protein